jgi:hypothetical protein
MNRLTASLFEHVLTVLLFPVLLIASALWTRHEREALSAANCAEYLNTEHGTGYTASEIDDAYRRATAFMAVEIRIDEYLLELEKR